jgi:hypothetical protein
MLHAVDRSSVLATVHRLPRTRARLAAVIAVAFGCAASMAVLVAGALLAVTTLVVVFLQRRFGRPPLASAAACASPTRLTVLEGGRRTR